MTFRLWRCFILKASLIRLIMMMMLFAFVESQRKWVTFTERIQTHQNCPLCGNCAGTLCFNKKVASTSGNSPAMVFCHQASKILWGGGKSQEMIQISIDCHLVNPYPASVVKIIHISRENICVWGPGIRCDDYRKIIIQIPMDRHQGRGCDE